MNFKTILDLKKTISKNLHIFCSYDGIIGVPRSGYFAASIAGLLTEVPFTDLDSFINKKDISRGKTRLSKKNIQMRVKFWKKILVVDDSLNSGKSLLEVKKKLNHLDLEIDYLVVYGDLGAKSQVKYCLEFVQYPRMFEWNFKHHPLTSSISFDMDGVICQDPKIDEEQSPKKYINEIEMLKPLFKPTFKLGTIITSRLEKHRLITKKWLEKHNFYYEKLIMLKSDSNKRKKYSLHASFKASNYLISNSKLFIESDKNQAIEINKLTGKGVFCTENGVFYNERGFYSIKKNTRHFLRFLRYHFLRIFNS